jgi:large repetitive protein
VHVTDQYGNATPGYTVTFAVAGGGGGTTGATPLTDATGNAAVGSWTPGSTAPGPNQLSATVTGGSNPSTTFTVYVPPTAANDSSQVMGNTTLSSSVAPNARANDASLNGGTVRISSLAPIATVRGGTITFNADSLGSFTYLPPAGNVLRDSALYTIRDGTSPIAAQTSQAYVKLRFVGKVWYVDSSGANGDGRDSSPFSSVANAEVSAAVNDTILVRTGGATTGGGTLKNGQTLRGQGHNAAFTTTLNGNSVTLLATGTAPNVGALTLGSGNSLRGMRIFNAAGGGLTGASIGTLSIGEMSIGVTGGAALNLASGTVTGNGGSGAVVLDSVRSTNSSSTGISLSTVAGTLTVNGGTASNITNPTAAAVSISGSNPVFSFPGTISKTNAAGVGINLASMTGGSATFSGPSIVLSTGTSAGINMTSSAATVSFVDSVKVTTTTGNGVNATGGGTLTIAGTHNSITSVGGIALNVSGTTIGAGGLNFRSISANGGSNGIVLNTTGSTAGLTVSGSGSAASGGTIQNVSAAGIQMTSTLSPSFDRMSIQNSGDNGVRGTTVTNFTFTNGTINNTGTGGVLEGAGIGFNVDIAGATSNLSGAVTITGNTISNSKHGIDIFSRAGTISNATISTNTITNNNFTGSGIRFVAFGTATSNAQIQQATLNANVVRAAGLGIQVQCGNANTSNFVVPICGTSALQPVSVTSNDLQGTAANRFTGEGLLVLVNGRGTGFFNITGNTVRFASGTLISHSSFGVANVTSTISNNTVANCTVSGCQGIGFGVSATAGFTSAPIINATVTGNNVSATQTGIFGAAGDSDGTLKATITGNTTTGTYGSGARPGIRIQGGNSIGDVNVCVDIRNNTADAIGGASGVGVRKQGTLAGTNDFGVVGIAGTLASPTASTAVESFLSGQNPASAIGANGLRAYTLSGNNYLGCTI